MSSPENSEEVKILVTSDFRVSSVNLVGDLSASSVMLATSDFDYGGASGGGNKYLSKVVDDIAAGDITFLKSVITDYLHSINYSMGELGSGYYLGKYGDTEDSYLELDRLLVRKIAYFVELVIKKLSHVGGAIILTPASLTCERVEEYPTYYRCYFKQKDGDREIHNEFVVDDLARCQSFNVKEGVNHNVGNTYYWRRVVGVGADHIDLSKSDCDPGSMAPKGGDDIVQLGHLSLPERQNAIILNSYGNDAPSFKTYQKINSYSLVGKEVSAQEFDSITKRMIFRIFGDMYVGNSGRTNYLWYDQDGGLRIKAKELLFETTNGSYSDINDVTAETAEGVRAFAENAINAVTDNLSNDPGAYLGLKTIIDSLSDLETWTSKGTSENITEFVKGYLKTTTDFSFLGNAGIKTRYDSASGKYVVDTLNGSGLVTASNYATLFSAEIKNNGLATKDDVSTIISQSGLVTTANYATLFTSEVTKRNLATKGDITTTINSSNLVTTSSFASLFSSSVTTNNLATKGDITTTINASGLVTTSSFASLFSAAVTSNGVAKTADITAAVKNFVTADGVKTIISQVSIKADKIDFTGSSTFKSGAATALGLGSLAYKGSVSTGEVTGLGSLATKNSISASEVTGLGSLAKLNSIGTSYITGLGSLATLNSVSYSNLVTDLKNLIDGKAASSSLGSLAYLSKVGKAMLNETIISGGYLLTSLIDVENLYVKKLYSGISNNVITLGNSSITCSNVTSSGSIDHTYCTLSMGGTPGLQLRQYNNAGRFLVSCGTYESYMEVNIDSTTAHRFRVSATSSTLAVYMSGLPTSKPSSPGQLYKSGNYLMIS